MSQLQNLFVTFVQMLQTIGGQDSDTLPSGSALHSLGAPPHQLTQRLLAPLGHGGVAGALAAPQQTHLPGGGGLVSQGAGRAVGLGQETDMKGVV